MFDSVLTTDTFVLAWHRETDRLVFAVFPLSRLKEV